MIRLILFSLLFNSFIGNASQISGSEEVICNTTHGPVESDNILAGIQGNIYDAFVNGLMSPKNDDLVRLSEALDQLYLEKEQNLILYWHSYLKYYSSIYYLKKGDSKAAEKEIEKGIKWLKGIKNKNSEDYALLAMLQSFGIQFKGIRAMFVSGVVKRNTEMAIAKDSTNLRAYYVYASSDLYTPEKYGGGKLAEEYLLKAISLHVQKIKNDYLPSWGKEEAYEKLVKLYIKLEKWESAKRYFLLGIEEFPESYGLSQSASKLVNK